MRGATCMCTDVEDSLVSGDGTVVQVRQAPAACLAACMPTDSAQGLWVHMHAHTHIPMHVYTNTSASVQARACV